MHIESATGWFARLSAREQVHALSLMYSSLTVSARQFFRQTLPDGKEGIVLEMLCGFNELHHTIANQLMRFSSGEAPYPTDVWLRMLDEIATKFGIQASLDTALRFAQVQIRANLK